MVDTVEALDQVAMGVVALLLAAISMRDFGPAHQQQQKHAVTKHSHLIRH